MPPLKNQYNDETNQTESLPLEVSCNVKLPLYSIKSNSDKEQYLS